MTWAEFKTEIRRRVFEENEAENLVENHNRWILDAAIDLQKKVVCLQQNQLDKIGQCSTYYLCGASTFCAPRGYLIRLYTIADDGYECEKVEYTPISKEEFDCLLKQAPCSATIAHPYGYYFDENTSLYTAFPDMGVPGLEVPDDTIDKACRATSGYWTLWKGNIYMYPHMQWDETACVEFDGIKLTYEETDDITWDRDVEDAIEYYLRAKSAEVDDCDLQKAAVFRNGLPGDPSGGYNGRVADLIWECKKRLHIPRRTPCFTNCC